jgi:hypothetical protein
MKTCCLLGMLALLSACATPKPIVDTAATVARMSNEMESVVSSYAKSLKSLRQADAERLEALRGDADRRRREPEDEMQILSLAGDARALAVLKSLASTPQEPVRAMAASKSSEHPVGFDGAPLKAVAKITADIAQPRGALEQLKALLVFARTVNADLQKATTENAKPKP